jgi:diguanylate cyclase (GGDEF)-like protein
MREALPDVLSSDLAEALMRTLQDNIEREVTVFAPSGDGQVRAFRNVVHRVDESTVVATFVENTREQRLEREFRVERRTGLATRAHFDEVFAELIAEHDRGGEPFGVLFVDLDKFKRINDEFSHVCGDEMITSIAHRLSGMAPIPHLIARWGGDEFVVLTRWGGSENRVFAEKILDTFAEPFTWQGQEIVIRSSIGAITVQGVGYEGRQVLLDVDHAMYEAKRQGGNRVIARILE